VKNVISLYHTNFESSISSFKETKELKVMDLAAFTLARDHGMPIRVFNMCKPGVLRKVVLGTEEGTTIS